MTGVFGYREGIAVAQIVTFAVPLLCAIYFKAKHQIGWFCLGVFTLLRLISASCKLALIDHDSHGLWAAIFVCESLGLILIMFLLLEMLERINKIPTVVANRIFWIPSIITWIDIIISIVGWVVVMHAEHPLAPTPYSQASTTLLAAIYLYVVWVFWGFWKRRSEYMVEEWWLLKGVAICLPALAIRLVYSLIFVITGNMKFNAIKGNSTAYLMMTMLPEVLIIWVCTYVITFRISILAEDATKRAERLGDEESEGELDMR